MNVVKQNRQNFLKFPYKGLFLISFFLIYHVISAQTDFLGISSITLDGKAYKLKWSANTEHRTRIIEEYLLPNESVTRYNTKLTVEFIRSGKKMEDIVEAKLTDLDNEKQEGRVLNFNKLESADPDEMAIEFLVGNVLNGVTHSIEWNVYRYKLNAGGVILFAMSKRAYEEKNVNPFMQEVRENRLNWINSIINYKLPEIYAGNK